MEVKFLHSFPILLPIHPYTYHKSHSDPPPDTQVTNNMADYNGSRSTSSAVLLSVQSYTYCKSHFYVWRSNFFTLSLYYYPTPHHTSLHLPQISRSTSSHARTILLTVQSNANIANLTFMCGGQISSLFPYTTTYSSPYILTLTANLTPTLDPIHK